MHDFLSKILRTENEVTRNDCDGLLTEMECHGMKPPSYPIMYDSIDGTRPIESYYVEGEAKWEDEDEKK